MVLDEVYLIWNYSSSALVGWAEFTDYSRLRHGDLAAKTRFRSSAMQNSSYY